MSLVASCALIAAVVIPAGILSAWIVARRLDAQVLLAASLAVGVCWLAASLALVSTHVGARLGFPVQGLLVGMLFRMGLPLGAGVALSQNAPLAELGIFGMILGVYLCALVVETVLSLRYVQPAPVRPTAS
jgi:hypothetical protein